MCRQVEVHEAQGSADGKRPTAKCCAKHVAHRCPLYMSNVFYQIPAVLVAMAATSADSSQHASIHQFLSAVLSKAATQLLL